MYLNWVKLSCSFKVVLWDKLTSWAPLSAITSLSSAEVISGGTGILSWANIGPMSNLKHTNFQYLYYIIHQMVDTHVLISRVWVKISYTSLNMPKSDFAQWVLFPDIWLRHRMLITISGFWYFGHVRLKNVDCAHWYFTAVVLVQRIWDVLQKKIGLQDIHKNKSSKQGHSDKLRRCTCIYHFFLFWHADAKICASRSNLRQIFHLLKNNQNHNPNKIS